MPLFDLHPVIRIITFLVLGTYLSLGRPADLAAAGLMMMVLYAALERAHLLPALATLRRMRWFFLSIVIIYFWFTPGHPLWPGAAGAVAPWLPTAEGARMGLVRAAALALFVLGVTLLLQTTSRSELIAGIRWIVRPFSLGGRFHDKLALRIALVLETVPRIQPMVQEALPRREGEKTHPVKRIGAAAARLVALAQAEAQRAPCNAIELPPDPHPPLGQWIWPVLVAVVLGLL